MNRKGEGITIGYLIIAFVTLIVTLALFIAIAQQVGTVRTSETLSNSSQTAPAVNVTLELTGQDLLSTPIVTNATGGEVINTANYTFDTGVSTITGWKTVQYTTLDGSSYASQPINVSYSYGPDGYANNSGARSIALLIVIFSAIAIAVVAIVPVMREKLFNV